MCSRSVVPVILWTVESASGLMFAVLFILFDFDINTCKIHVLELDMAVMEWTSNIIRAFNAVVLHNSYKYED